MLWKFCLQHHFMTPKKAVLSICEERFMTFVLFLSLNTPALKLVLHFSYCSSLFILIQKHFFFLTLHAEFFTNVSKHNFTVALWRIFIFFLLLPKGITNRLRVNGKYENSFLSFLCCNAGMKWLVDELKCFQQIKILVSMLTEMSIHLSFKRQNSWKLSRTIYKNFTNWTHFELFSGQVTIFKGWKFNNGT